MINNAKKMIGISLFIPFLFISSILFGQLHLNDPLTTSSFRVVFDKIQESGFIKVTGLSSETYLDLENEPLKTNPQKQLKPVHFIITRKAIKPDALWEWRADIISGKNDRRDGRIDLLNKAGESVFTWEIVNAWPFKWVWPALDANDSQIATEEIHFLAEAVFPAGKRVIPLPTLIQTYQFKNLK